jgi:hypothetical protein
LTPQPFHHSWAVAFTPGVERSVKVTLASIGPG